MDNIVTKLKNLISQARGLHERERNLVYQSVMLIGELAGYNPSVSLRMTEKEYAAALGLTLDMYQKRLQAARVLKFIPELNEIFRQGKTHVAQLAMLSPRITEANKDQILAFLPGRSKRELADFLETIDKAGNRFPAPDTVTISLTMTREEFDMLKRAQDVLSARGHNASEREAIVAGACSYGSNEAPRTDPSIDAKSVVSGTAKSLPTKAPGQKDWDKNIRQYIPQKVRRRIWLRDQGQCSFVSRSGERCDQTRMLEVDHRNPVARGGSNTLENLALLCRRHNLGRAMEVFGTEWMRRKIQDSMLRGRIPAPG